MIAPWHTKGGNNVTDTPKSRKRFATNIDVNVLQDFKVACVKNKLDMNEVLEVLMQAYSDGILNLKELSDE
jgi:hypothetical protein